MINKLLTMLHYDKRYMLVRDVVTPVREWHFPEIILNENIMWPPRMCCEKLCYWFGINRANCTVLFEIDNNVQMFYCDCSTEPKSQNTKIYQTKLVTIEELFDMSKELEKQLRMLLPYVGFYVRH